MTSGRQCYQSPSFQPLTKRNEGSGDENGRCGMNCVRSKDAHKQLARNVLNFHNCLSCVHCCDGHSHETLQPQYKICFKHIHIHVFIIYGYNTNSRVIISQFVYIAYWTDNRRVRVRFSFQAELFFRPNFHNCLSCIHNNNQFNYSFCSLTAKLQEGQSTNRIYTSS